VAELSCACRALTWTFPVPREQGETSHASVAAKECLGVPLLTPGLAVGQCSVLNTTRVQVRPSITSSGAVTEHGSWAVTAASPRQADTEQLAPMALRKASCPPFCCRWGHWCYKLPTQAKRCPFSRGPSCTSHLKARQPCGTRFGVAWGCPGIPPT